MDSRKLERILVWILLLLNLFLLVVVFSDSTQARRSSKETAASLSALLEANGISAAEGAITIRSAPDKYVLTRDLRAEQLMIARIIGKQQVTDVGGNILLYDGTRGRAQMRGSGEMDVLFDSDSVTLRGGAERTVQRLLRRAGISAVAVERKKPGGNSLEFRCELDGIPVYNAVLRADFMGEQLSMLTGIRIFDSAEKVETEDLLDSVSVLIRFLELVRDEGYICSRIDAVTPG